MKLKDDFNWENYTTQYYEREMKDEFQAKNIPLIITEPKFDGKNEVEYVDDLHPNWKELYHTIHRLGVESIFECGCGCAHHLINSKILNKDLTCNGCDYAQSQIDVGVRYFNLSNYDFADRLKVVDLVDGDTSPLGKHEFVYTQAVTMHLSYDRAKKFLYNMKSLSSKYIYLIENITVHDYDTLISEVFPEFERVNNEGKYIDYGILLKRK
jgi:hypothetical protein